jgi:hypothetical protein
MLHIVQKEKCCVQVSNCHIQNNLDRKYVYIINDRVLYFYVKNVQSGTEHILFQLCVRPKCDPSTMVTLRPANTWWKLIINN